MRQGSITPEHGLARLNKGASASQECLTSVLGYSILVVLLSTQLPIFEIGVVVRRGRKWAVCLGKSSAFDLVPGADVCVSQSQGQQRPSYPSKAGLSASILAVGGVVLSLEIALVCVLRELGVVRGRVSGGAVSYEVALWWDLT